MAAEIRHQAAGRAAAIRQAAEREAAELRAHMLAMSAELGRVAAYVTENLTAPALPGAAPAALPATEPKTRPAAKPAARPAAKPKTRQYRAMRRITATAAVLVFLAVIVGSAEIAQHGFSFFVFRQGGTGSTPGSVISDNQFLARAHHEAPAHRPAHGQHQPRTPKPKAAEPKSHRPRSHRPRRHPPNAGRPKR